MTTEHDVERDEPDRGDRSRSAHPAGRRGRTARRVAAVGGLAAVVSLGGYTAASATTTKSAAPTTVSAPSGRTTPTPRTGVGVAPGGFAGGGPGGGASGTVKAIGSGSLTITSADGTTETFTTNGSTAYARDGASVEASALSVGDEVVVEPDRSSSSTATEVSIVSPSVAGTVVSASGDIVVVDDGGFWRTVDVTSSTAYTDGGQSSSLTAVAAGESVVASGTVASDRTTLDASTLAIELPRTTGRVTAVSGSTLTLLTFAGSSVTVDTTAATVYASPSGSTSPSAVAVGDVVTAEGHAASDGTVTATELFVGNPPAGGPAGGPAPSAG